MLSDNDAMKTVPSGRRRAVDTESRKHWSDSQKIEAVTTYLALGNLALTAAVLKIPEVTLRKWKATVWWSEIEGELRVQENLQLSTRLQKIINNTLSVAEDRIQNGDFIYDSKIGELVRKPVSLKDAHRVAMDMMDKREHLVSKAPVNIAMEQIDERLAKLAKQFEDMAKPKTVVEVTDVVVGTEVEDDGE